MGIRLLNIIKYNSQTTLDEFLEIATICSTPFRYTKLQAALQLKTIYIITNWSRIELYLNTTHEI